MKKRSAVIYMTEEEFNAVCEAIDNLQTQCESAGDEYVENTEPTIQSLISIHTKFKKAECKASERELLIDAVKERLSCTRGEAVKLIKQVK